MMHSLLLDIVVAITRFTLNCDSAKVSISLGPTHVINGKVNFFWADICSTFDVGPNVIL